MPFPLLPVAVLLILGAVLLFAHDTGVGDNILGEITGRGLRVGPHAAVNGLGVVPTDPAQLAAAAALEPNAYALARLISSEEGNSELAIKVAVGWAAWNKHGAAIFDVLTSGKGDADEHFKAQSYEYTSAPGQTSKAAAYASTAQDPHEDDVKIAQGIMTGTIADPTGGATNFFRPGLQDELFADGKVSRDGAGVIADWTAGGLAQVQVPGIDPSEIAFFKGAS